ncbi:MAG TPA: tetratricopeptide repeat protein, partial [Pirellulales bacterium]|nr:tetratricopeptide repeat protein [Pirellulales bacterium]
MVMDTPPRGLDEYTRTVTAISSAMGQGDLRRAYELADWAIGRGMEGRVIYNARALAYQASERFNEAIIDFRKALTYAPNDYAIYNAIGTTLHSQGRPREAVEAFDASLAIKPAEAATHYRRGLALGQLLMQEEAETAFQSALAIKPDHAEALASIASIAARKGDFAKTRDYADRSLALSQADPIAHYSMALAEMGEHQYQQAEWRLRQIVLQPGISSEMRGGIYSLLGDSIDAQGRYAEAFEVYARGKEFVRRAHVEDYKDGRVADTVPHLMTYFETASTDRWKPASSGEALPDGPSEHVFLLG